MRKVYNNGYCIIGKVNNIKKYCKKYLLKKNGLNDEEIERLFKNKILIEVL